MGPLHSSLITPSWRATILRLSGLWLLIASSKASYSSSTFASSIWRGLKIRDAGFVHNLSGVKHLAEPEQQVVKHTLPGIGQSLMVWQFVRREHEFGLLQYPVPPPRSSGWQTQVLSGQGGLTLQRLVVWQVDWGRQIPPSQLAPPVHCFEVSDWFLRPYEKGSVASCKAQKAKISFAPFKTALVIEQGSGTS
jgi:hypothetical protein